MPTRSFPSKIFIDGGIPQETAEAKKLLGFLDGQTTNPSLIAKNLAARLSPLSRLTPDKAVGEYKRIVREISKIIPNGSISIQVFASLETKSEEMLAQARERIKWIPNGSIKLPAIYEGLKTAQIVCQEFPINITLVFSQSQAAAVYEATRGARFPVFISPFVGRLDDRGENGMEVVKNILRMYDAGDHHVEVLTASTRNIDHVLYALHLESDIVTIPYKVFKIWADGGFQTPPPDYVYPVKNLAPVPYDEKIVLGKSWQDYNLHHDLTDKGVTTFWNDWNSLLS
jgi:transaldolase